MKNYFAIELGSALLWALTTHVVVAADCNVNTAEDAADVQHTLLVAELNRDAVRRFGAETGQLIDEVVPSGTGGLNGPRGMIIGPDGNLYLSNVATDEVLRFDARNGQFIDVFVDAGSGGLDWPHALLFLDSGNLLVSSRNTDAVLEFNGADGSFIGEFVAGGSGGLTLPHGLAIGHDGNLLVVSRGSNEVLRFDGETGGFIDSFASGGGLINPIELEFGPDGHLYVTGRESDAVLRYNGDTGEFIDVFTNGGALDGPTGAAFGPDGNLYVSSLFSNEVLYFAGNTGDFIDAFVISGEIERPGFLLFAQPHARDCNANAVPDSCDIETGTSTDSNSDTVPDECEFEGGELLMSFLNATEVPGVGLVEDEDIVALDLLTGTWELVFDGSDIGLAPFNIDAVTMISGDAGPDFLISLEGTNMVGGIVDGPNGSEVSGSDVLRLAPGSLGGTTSGTLSFYFDGSDVGLDSTEEDIDALSSLPQQRLAVSVRGALQTGNVFGSDEDMAFIRPTSLGAATEGRFRLLFDGSDVALSAADGEGLNAASLNNVRRPLLSMPGDFDVVSVAGDGNDIVEFTFMGFGTETAGDWALELDLGAVGLPAQSNINALEELNPDLLQ